MKAPAFKFYPDNWLGGTMGMSFEEQGAYLNLLILQNQKGAFSEAQARKLLGNNYERLWTSLKEKFLIDGAGKFFNERLLAEQQKRETYSKLQKERADMRWHPSGNASAIPVNEIETDTAIKNENDSFEKSEKLLTETSLPCEMLKVWEQAKPIYPVDKLKDLPALFGIQMFIREQAIKNKADPHFGTVTDEDILNLWQQLVTEALKDKFWKDKTLQAIGNSIQQFWNKANKNGNRQQSQKLNYDKLKILTGNGGHGSPYGNQN